MQSFLSITFFKLDTYHNIVASISDKGRIGFLAPMVLKFLTFQVDIYTTGVHVVIIPGKRRALCCLYTRFQEQYFLFILSATLPSRWILKK